jgi:hypothetical protein
LKLTSGQFGASSKISTSTAVLKQTKEIIDPLFILSKDQKRQLLKLRFQKTDNPFRGKNQNR